MDTQKRNNMLTFDTLVLILVAAGALAGLLRGFVRQALGLVGIVLGVCVAYKFSGVVGAWWTRQFAVNKINAHVLTFILMLMASSVSAMMLARAIERVLAIALLGWLNRLAGMVFGAVQVVLVLAAILYGYNALELKTSPEVERWLTASASQPLLLDLANLVYPYLKFE